MRGRVAGLAAGLMMLWAASATEVSYAATAVGQKTAVAAAPAGLAPEATASPAPAASTTSPVRVGKTIRAAPPTASASSTIAATIGDYFFKPGTLSIAVGDTVVWTNDGTVSEGHTVTADGFDSGTLETGATYSHTFASAGTFSYICAIHPAMKGTVIVGNGSGSGSGGGGGGGGESTGGGSTGGGDNSTGGNGTGGSDTNGAGTSDTGGSGGGSTGGGGGSSSGVNAPTANGGGGGTAAHAQPAATSASGGSLPFSGLNLILLGELGVLVIVSGLLIRRVAIWAAPTDPGGRGCGRCRPRSPSRRRRWQEPRRRATAPRSARPEGRP